MTAALSRPSTAVASAATIEAASIITLMAIIALSRVGGGGAVSDQGSNRNGKRKRKFCHIAAAVSVE